MTADPDGLSCVAVIGMDGGTGYVLVDADGNVVDLGEEPEP